jgi:hypothetical protein
MLTIVWSPNGLPLIDAMPKGERYSVRYYVDDILTPISERFIPAGKGQLVIHTDRSLFHTTNVVLDFVSQSKGRFAPNHPYSPNIALSDLSFSATEKTSRGTLVFRLVRSILLRYENWWGRSHLKLYWTFFTTGLQGAKV